MIHGNFKNMKRSALQINYLKDFVDPHLTVDLHFSVKISSNQKHLILNVSSTNEHFKNNSTLFKVIINVILRSIIFDIINYVSRFCSASTVYSC